MTQHELNYPSPNLTEFRIPTIPIYQVRYITIIAAPFVESYYTVLIVEILTHNTHTAPFVEIF